MSNRPSDSDPAKWDYRLHTRVKHRLLEQYLKGWLPILTRGARRKAVQRIRLMVVDGFAGRGRYVGGEPGSPLIFAGVASQFVQQGLSLPKPHRVEVECVFIESDADNCTSLTRELDELKIGSSTPSEVHLRSPIHGEFADAISPLLDEARSKRIPIFVFADPFGFAGIPLATMKEILAVPHAEVFITFMVQPINRFFTTTDRDNAFAELFGIHVSELQTLRDQLAGAPDREAQLRDPYIDRLKQGAGAEFIWAFRVLPEEGASTLYYLVHASQDISALRHMKNTMKRQGTQGEFTFFGSNDFARRAQPLLFGPDDEGLKHYALEKFAGQTVTFRELCDILLPDPACYHFTDPDFNRTVRELRNDGQIEVTKAGPRGGLRHDTVLTFPATVAPRLL